MKGDAVLIAAMARDPEDFLVDEDRPHVIARYFAYLGTEVPLPVWAEDIPDEVWELAEQDAEEDDGDAEETHPDHLG
jgi:hypothetical protein